MSAVWPIGTSAQGAVAETPAPNPASNAAWSARADYLLLCEILGPRTPMLVLNFWGATLIVAMLWGSAVRHDLIVWAALITVVTLLRQQLARRFGAREPGPAATAFWTRAYAFGAFASGLLWGLSAWLFPAPTGAHSETFLLMIAGLSAASLCGYAVSPVIYVSFLIPATLPYGWLLSYPDGVFKPGSAAMFFAWLTIVIGVAHMRARAIASSISRQGAEHERLVRGEIERQVRSEIGRETARREGEEKARVVAQLSHELRTPLNAIVGFSEAIKHGAFGPLGNPRYSAYADHIHDSGRHLLEIIERALSSRTLGSEIPALVEGDVDLGEVANEAAAMFEDRARQRSVKLVVAVEEPTPCIHGNAEKLKQVLINLVSNAVKFTPPRGRITITVATSSSEGVVLRVSDTGMGMDLQQVAQALDPARVPRRFAAGGPGLEQARGVGLLIAKWLTELHGGRLSVESVKGEGTTVIVRLPAERLLLRVVAPESRTSWSAAAE